MKRYPAYEFPEYVHWNADPEVISEFQRLTEDPQRSPYINALTEEQMLSLYTQLVKARLHDIQLKRWVKQGVITKAWLGSGEEAVTIGMCAALNEGDVVGPMIRNAGALIARGVPLEVCFAAYLGTTDTIARGRDLHIGDPARGVIPPISHVGDIVPVMAGCALAFKLRNEPRLALTWTGDGSTATGIFHEGMRVASALKTPFISVIQDNQVALGTRHEVHHQGRFESWGEVYGIPCLSVDGNHVLDCYAAAMIVAQRARSGEGPALIVARTFRMGGHATHDEREARQLFGDQVYQYWGARDPIGCYEAWLMTYRGISRDQLEDIEQQAIQEIDTAARFAQSRKQSHAPSADEVTRGVYAEPF